MFSSDEYVESGKDKKQRSPVGQERSAVGQERSAVGQEMSTKARNSSHSSDDEVFFQVFCFNLSYPDQF